jgi:dynein heavy chain
MKYEQIVNGIKEEWQTLDLKIIPYKNSLDAYILIETDTITSIIEDHLTTLEGVENSAYAVHVKEDVIEWIKNLKVMQSNLEKWVDAQRTWMYLDPIFSTLQM